jgi:hypothetical protein
MRRRTFLSGLAASVASTWVASLADAEAAPSAASSSTSAPPASGPPASAPSAAAGGPSGARTAGYSLTTAEERLLDEVEQAAFAYFWEQAPEHTGQVKDRARAVGSDDYVASSIAATGFGLTALCIGAHRGYAVPPAGQARSAEGAAVATPSREAALARPRRELIKERVRTTLRFVAHQLPHEHGWYYHFVDMQGGARLWGCELSSIDTALLLAGVLTCRTCFAEDAEIVALAGRIYERVDFGWMLNGGPTLSMGYKPESGFLEVRWEHYCELMMLYLLGLGSPTHALPAATWHAFKRPRVRYFGHEYISGTPALFTHQYSHAWFDFRGVRDAYADYFANSVEATLAHQAFCRSLGYSAELWGVSASDTPSGYRSWGGPPADGPLDGTVVPCAAGGSLVFAPRATLQVLHAARQVPGAWCRYGYIDAFHPTSGWRNPDVIGIDVGITMLMAENLRSGWVWEIFMANPEMRRAMTLAGFVPAPSPSP